LQYISFFTATILNWKHLLLDDHYKDIVISSMRFLVKDNRVSIFAFVLMPNHIHLVWKIANDRKKDEVQRDFLKYTAQKIKRKLTAEKPEELKPFYVGAKDRKYQFWERNPLTSRLPSEELIVQKINYIHANPVRGKWNLCKEFYDYKYSSAGFYYRDDKTWDFLTHYADAMFE
jgi:putative transposase